MVENGPGKIGKTKQVCSRFFYIKEKIHDGMIKVEHTPSEYIVADGFTKILSKQKFLKWRRMMLNSE